MLSYPYLFDEGSLEGIVGVDIVTWTDGADEEIVAMIAAADEGRLTLTDYWAVGDERTFHLGSIPKGGYYSANPTAMAEQDIVMVLMNEGYMGQEGINFVVGQKDCLNQTCKMYYTGSNSGSWNSTYMKSFLNKTTSGGYLSAFSGDIISIFKDFTITTAASYNGSTNQTCIDKFALFAEKEIFGSRSYSNYSEAAALSQISYYKTSSNRVKHLGATSGACSWYERSPNNITDYFGNPSYYCQVNAQGSAYYNSADREAGAAPFGCI